MKWNEIFQIFILKSIHWKNIIKKNNVIIKPCSPSATLPLYLSHTTKTLPPPPLFFVDEHNIFWTLHFLGKNQKVNHKLMNTSGPFKKHPVTVAASLLQT